MLKIFRFSKHCSCHFQGEYVGWAFLEALYSAGCRWLVEYDGCDWQSGRVGEWAAIQLDILLLL
jgi:hypothetical protein